jgi:rRNA maturation RNase YbeY
MILFHNECVEVPDFDQELFCSWLTDVITHEGFVLGEIQFVFCSDEYLLGINKQHLKHDYYTDIITFDYCDNEWVNGDLYISIERISENADLYKVQFFEEFKRVSVHGVLHLLGYKDKTPNDSETMRAKEDFYLSRYVSRGT